MGHLDVLCLLRLSRLHDFGLLRRPRSVERLPRRHSLDPYRRSSLYPARPFWSVSEISKVRAHLKAVYFVDPGRLPGWTDLQAEFAGKSNEWRIFIVPDTVSVDPIDIPATIGNLFKNLVEKAIEDLLPSWLPEFVKDLLMALLKPVVDIVQAVMGVFDNVEDFLQDLLDNQFNFLVLIQTAIVDYFANKYPIEKIEDPFPILTDPPLIPVKIPLRNLKSNVNSKEMIVTGDIG